MLCVTLLYGSGILLGKVEYLYHAVYLSELVAARQTLADLVVVHSAQAPCWIKWETFVRFQAGFVAAGLGPAV